MNSFVQHCALQVHRRNGGHLEVLDPNLNLLDTTLGLDSLDLAEIMAAIAKNIGTSPFDNGSPPKTWGEVSEFVNHRAKPGD